MTDDPGALPRYLLAHEFSRFEGYLSDGDCTARAFESGDQLWKPGEFIERVYYIKNGIARTVVVHENGREKTLYFHGPGSVWPSCQQTRYRIELSLVTTAVTHMDVLEFTLDEFRRLAWGNKDLASEVLEDASRFVNIGIYEAAHQVYNNSMVRLCNLLYLLYENEQPKSTRINLSQAEIAQLLGIDRTNAARYLSALGKEGVVRTHRGWLEIADVARLAGKCTIETRI